MDLVADTDSDAYEEDCSFEDNEVDAKELQDEQEEVVLVRNQIEDFQNMQEAAGMSQI
jgi:hypothetical protein